VYCKLQSEKVTKSQFKVTACDFIHHKQIC